MTPIYVVVVSYSGIIEGVSLFRDGEKADAFAAKEGKSLTGSAELSVEGDWHNDNYDVWVFVADSFEDDDTPLKGE